MGKPINAPREPKNYADPAWLRGQISAILNFWYPTARDTHHGGFLNLLDGDGTVLNGTQKHLVASSRFAVLFSTGVLAETGLDWCKEAAGEAVDFLYRVHRDDNLGGYFWVVDRAEPVDRRKQAYGHAFVILAGATALRAGVSGGRELMEDAIEVADKRLFRGGALAINTANEDFSEISAYRGQNPNMHFCEAFISAYEATGEKGYLDRAYCIAERIAYQLATAGGGFVWENYTPDWRHDWDERQRDESNFESTIGMMPGHQIEWAKLLALLARYRPEGWLLPQAKHLYHLGWEHGWDHAHGGFYTGLNRGLSIVDRQPAYWATSEAIGAAAVLGAATSEDSYWDDYRSAWDHALDQLVDHEHGGWFKVPSLKQDRIDTRKGDGVDPDYHPAAACLEAIRSVGLMAHQFA